MDSQPLVTVIVPSYNHSKYVAQCIESIVSQTYKNFDLVVIDDGSTDNSPQVLRDLQSKYNFKLVLQENSGLAATLNFGIKEFATGKYVTFCASDDYWHVEKLRYQVLFMEENSNILMCYGKSKLVDEKNEVFTPKFNKFRGGYIFEDLFTLKYHLPVSYLFRTEVFNIVGFYDESLFAEDFDMNLRISSIYPIGFIDEYLIYYRLIGIKLKLSRYNRIIDSHLASIRKFKNHELYPMAEKMVLLGKLYADSTLTRNKKQALYLLFLLRGLVLSRSYLRSIYHLIFIWR